jgi:hypothetical protein
VRSLLEHPALPGEHNYGLFRSATQATSAVEEFMFLYHILLMIHRDSQIVADKFIVSEDPTVPQTPQPHKPAVMETLYTRLRNEVGHTRPGVNLDATKSEMAARLSGLRALTKRAIELHP